MVLVWMWSKAIYDSHLNYLFSDFSYSASFLCRMIRCALWGRYLLDSSEVSTALWLHTHQLFATFELWDHFPSFHKSHHNQYRRIEIVASWKRIAITTYICTTLTWILNKRFSCVMVYYRVNVWRLKTSLWWLLSFAIWTTFARARFYISSNIYICVWFQTHSLCNGKHKCFNKSSWIVCFIPSMHCFFVHNVT